MGRSTISRRRRRLEVVGGLKGRCLRLAVKGTNLRSRVSSLTPYILPLNLMRALVFLMGKLKTRVWGLRLTIRHLLVAISKISVSAGPAKPIKKLDIRHRVLSCGGQNFSNIRHLQPCSVLQGFV